MKRRTQNWVVIDVDRGITAYYRWMLLQYWYLIDHGGVRRSVHNPSWDAHMSVVRGEVSRRLSLNESRERWAQAQRLYDGKKVEVLYSNLIRQTGDTTNGDRSDQFWFVPSFSEVVVPIRNLLGLPNCEYPSGKPYTNHITIGRTYD